MNKIKLLRELRSNISKRSAWIESLPLEIRDAFYDNPYSRSLETERDELIRQVFGQDADSAFWFLYRFKPGYYLVDNGVQHTFNNDEEFYKYFETLI